MASNVIDNFINYLDANHQYINQVYIFFAIIYVVLVLLFDGFLPAIFSSIFTVITTFIGLWIINWLNTSNEGKYRLFGWILVGLSIISVINQLISGLIAKPKEAIEMKVQEAFISFMKYQKQDN